MNTSKYEAFLVTIETGSLTQAAENLGCTQSAVSHSIASLESELGFPLITRRRGGVRLTEEGAKLLDDSGQLTDYRAYPDRGILTEQVDLARVDRVAKGMAAAFVKLPSSHTAMKTLILESSNMISSSYAFQR